MDHNNPYHRDFKSLLKRAGLAGSTFHALRHTFATALFSRAEHPRVVQSLLGHTSITEAMDTYSHVLPDTQDEVVSALEGAQS